LKVSLFGRLSFFAARSPRWQTRLKTPESWGAFGFAVRLDVPHDACKQSVIAIDGVENWKIREKPRIPRGFSLSKKSFCAQGRGTRAGDLLPLRFAQAAACVCAQGHKGKAYEKNG
jgi:hypothetical protein